MAPATVVFAPDSFKGTLSADGAASALARGWASVRPDDALTLLPMADGGEGTVAAFSTAFPDARRMAQTVTGPIGRAVEAEWLLLADGTAVIELAEASGLTLLDGPQPFDAHTLGFGQLIAAALDAGATSLLLGIGGSSSTDGGAGALTALGARFLDASGSPINLGNRGLGSLDRVDLTGLRELPPGGAVVLSDVRSPLLGPLGAAAVFGPQKGANAADISGLEGNLARLAGFLGVPEDAPGAGAAGGTGFGLLAWGATLRAGAEAVGNALGLPAAVASADLVITGEGRFDSQSSAGKVPAYVVGLARKAEVQTALVAGSIDAAADEFAHAVSLAELAGSADVARAEAEHWLVEAGRVLASRWTPAPA